MVRLLENLGTVAVVTLASALANIALHARRYQQLGREALMCASAFIFAQALIRSLSINHVISPEAARTAVALTAVGALAVLVQIAWLRHLDHRLRDGE